MWWECSECGGHVERSRAPTLCQVCGTAGAIFVPAEQGLELDPEAESLRESWFLRGFDSRQRSELELS